MKKLFALLMMSMASSNFAVMTARADDCTDNGGWWVYFPPDDAWYCLPWNCWYDPASGTNQCSR